MKDLDFRIEIDQFNTGMAPLAHIDSDTFIGASGQASDMMADVITRPGYLTQSGGLSTLTNGDQNGDVTQLIRFILEEPTATNVTYALGTTKLFKLSATAVASSPQTVTGMTEGESLVRLGANVYGFFNKASGGDIFKMPITTEVIDATWGSVTDQALEDAPHPVGVKEDIMLFGNGRYVGAYIEGLATLDVQKLDFGEGSEVVDIVYSANYWWIAVNYTDRKSRIYMYDGSALSNILSDEIGTGNKSIGFIFPMDGVLYVAYTDVTSGTYAIGYVSGRVIKPIRYFSGSLPSHRQKTLYKNMLIFISDDELWSFGASVNQLPAQISKLRTAGLATAGAIASPFGNLMVSSLDGINAKIAVISGYATTGMMWKSIRHEVNKLGMKGNITRVIVYTSPLEDGAKAVISLNGDMGEETSEVGSIETAGESRHEFSSISLPNVDDVQVTIDFSGGSSTYDCPIRKIVLLGNFVEF